MIKACKGTVGVLQKLYTCLLITKYSLNLLSFLTALKKKKKIKLVESTGWA